MKLIGLKWSRLASISTSRWCTEPLVRVSYLMVTPSAARGILEAVFWKPEFRYQIREMRILRFGTQTAFLRNEIGKRQGGSPLVVEDERQQRTSLVLKNDPRCR